MAKDFDIRYRYILQLLKLGRRSSVLEIGALRPACLSMYIGRSVRYLGINKNYQSGKYRIKKADFLTNSFPSNSFTHCVSTDTLEHVPRAHRQKFIDEMVRCASELAIIGVPNPESKPYEDSLVTLLGASEQGTHYVKFFREHEAYGLPSREEMRRYLRRYKFTAVSNFSLKYWVGVLISDVFKVKLDVSKIKDLHELPTYRTFYVIRKGAAA
jgi:hypothetical protein